MSQTTRNLPDGTPPWIDSAVPDLDAAVAFHGVVFGREFGVGSDAPGFTWNIHLVAADVDATLARAVAVGGEVLGDAFDVPEQSRGALPRDPGRAGAQRSELVA